MEKSQSAILFRKIWLNLWQNKTPDVSPLQYIANILLLTDHFLTRVHFLELMITVYTQMHIKLCLISSSHPLTPVMTLFCFDHPSRYLFRTAYEKGHQRPPLTVYTFQAPDQSLSQPASPVTSASDTSCTITPKSPASSIKSASKPPLPTVSHNSYSIENKYSDRGVMLLHLFVY